MGIESARILIVEDEQEIKDLLAENLKEAGFENVFTAGQGQEAFNLCVTQLQDSQAFDLIISDWDMPVMNGIQFLEKIRKHPEMSETVFILITGVGTAETVKMASRHGVSSIILKPFQKETILEKVRAHLGGAGQNRAAGG